MKSVLTPEDLKLAECKVEAQLEPTEIVTKARRQVAEAIQNRKAIQDEYAAVLTDLKLQIESAQAEFDPIGHVESAGFDAATVAAITGGNAKRLLGI